MTFGQYIKNKRLEKGLSARELARRVDMSQGYLSQLENDKEKKPSAPMIKRLADGLELEYLDLLRRAGHVEKSDLYGFTNKDGTLTEKGKDAARLASKMNKEADENTVVYPVVINPESFPQPSTLRKRINLPYSYNVDGEKRETKNTDVFDYYYLTNLALDKNKLINMTYKGEPLDEESLKKVLGALHLILE